MIRQPLVLVLVFAVSPFVEMFAVLFSLLYVTDAVRFQQWPAILLGFVYLTVSVFYVFIRIKWERSANKRGGPLYVATPHDAVWHDGNTWEVSAVKLKQVYLKGYRDRANGVDVLVANSSGKFREVVEDIQDV